MSTKNKNIAYFLALSAFFGFSVFLSGRVDATPVISDVGVTVSTSTAQIIWTGSDTVAISDSYVAYGLDTNYILTSTRRSFPGNVSGTKYYFSSKLSNLSPGEKYYYKITLKNSTGELSTHADSFNVPFPDTTPPVISGITAAVQTESATISWETNEAASCYVEYWQTNGEKLTKEMLGGMKDHYIYLGGLATKTSYNYQVFCRDEAGNKGQSTVRSFSTSGNSNVPKDATKLQALVTGGGVNVTWINPPDSSFDRVKLVRLQTGSAGSPEDGQLVYEGRDQKYFDSGAIAGQKYFYTIFSLNAQGQYSGGTTAVVGNGVVKIPESSVGSADKIFLSQIEFYTNRHSRVIDSSSGTIGGTAGADLSVSVPISVLAYTPESIQLTIGGSELHQLTLSGNQRSYTTDLFFPSAGKNIAYLVVEYDNGQKDVIQFNISSSPAPVETPIVVQPKIEPKPKTETKVSEQITQVADAVGTISNDQEVKSKVSAAAPTVVGVTAVGAISVLSWVNIIPFLQLLIQPLSFLGKKKSSGTGFVYNSLNKLPIDLATVRLLSRETGKVIQSKVTDSQGRYAFTVLPGLYKIQVIKNGYIFPTQILKDFRDDGKRSDIYHGQTIEASVGNNIVASNIPIDPAGDYDIPIFKLWGQKIFKSVQSSLVWAGLVVIIISLYISPRWYTALLLPVQVLVLVMTQRLSQKPKAKSWGVITDAINQKPIDQAIVRLFNAELNKLIASQVTDSRGRYYFIAGEDRYYVTVEKSGFRTQKTGIIDLVGKKIQTVSVDVALQAER